MGEHSENTLYIEGCGYKGVPAFECDIDPIIRDYINHSLIQTSKDGLTITSTIKPLTKHMLFTLCGLYSWVLQYCPNNRVVHLAKYGRTKRIRNKNLNRAIKILCRYIKE